jgi:alginate O-acetyltransferase complex protein AlgI
MLFTSLQYALFLPVVVVLFWTLPQRYRFNMLLVASYIFYGSWMPAFLLLIVPMTLFNWLYGRLLHARPEQKKVLFGLGVAVNLAILGVFKYANFFLDSVRPLLQHAGGHGADWTLNIILPLGISFFTFEFIHYLFEIYRGNKPVDSFVLFALYAAFFPTQIAGPIKRYPDFVAQMQEVKPCRLSYFDDGIPLIVVGLAKKILLADTLAVFVQMGLSDPSAYGAVELWLFAFAFAFQIYFDFSGYTDIARGSAELFGYHIPINFNMPYIASNIAEFWHRWHISLSSWLRDYLFIPLGGSRGSRWQTNKNLLLTMSLGGLWHGASWNFLVWGVYHGLLLVLHREFGFLKRETAWLRSAVDSKAGHAFCTFFTFMAVCVGWIFFRVQNINVAANIVKKMVTLHPLFTRQEAQQIVVLNPQLPVVVPVALLLVGLLLIGNVPLSVLNGRGVIRRAHPLLKSAFCTAMVLLIVVFAPDDSAPFIYFQF